MTIRTCARCGETKPETEFYKWRRQCKACRLEMQAAWYRANRDYALERERFYRERARERRMTAAYRRMVK